MNTIKFVFATIVKGEVMLRTGHSNPNTLMFSWSIWPIRFPECFPNAPKATKLATAGFCFFKAIFYIKSLGESVN